MTEISFNGKKFVYNHHLAVSFWPLEMHANTGIGAASLGGNPISDSSVAPSLHLPMPGG